MIEKLDYTQLKRIYKQSDITHKTKKEMDRIIGQSSGAEALKFGLSIKRKGYNIYAIQRI